MNRKLVAVSAACVALVCAIWLLSASGQQVAPERPKSFEWVCCIQYACEDDEGGITYTPVSGDSHPDRDQAWANVLAACQGAISGQPNCECCASSPANICQVTNTPENDCVDIPTALKQVIARKTDKYEEQKYNFLVSTAVMRYEIEGV